MDSFSSWSGFTRPLTHCKQRDESCSREAWHTTSLFYSQVGVFYPPPVAVTFYFIVRFLCSYLFLMCCFNLQPGVFEVIAAALLLLQKHPLWGPSKSDNGCIQTEGKSDSNQNYSQIWFLGLSVHNVWSKCPNGIWPPLRSGERTVTVKTAGCVWSCSDCPRYDMKLCPECGFSLSLQRSNFIGFCYCSDYRRGIWFTLDGLKIGFWLAVWTRPFTLTLSLFCSDALPPLWTCLVLFSPPLHSHWAHSTSPPSQNPLLLFKKPSSLPPCLSLTAASRSHQLPFHFSPWRVSCLGV